MADKDILLSKLNFEFEFEMYISIFQFYNMKLQF